MCCFMFQVVFCSSFPSMRNPIGVASGVLPVTGCPASPSGCSHLPLVLWDILLLWRRLWVLLTQIVQPTSPLQKTIPEPFERLKRNSLYFFKSSSFSSFCSLLYFFPSLESCFLCLLGLPRVLLFLISPFSL